MRTGIRANVISGSYKNVLALDDGPFSYPHAPGGAAIRYDRHVIEKYPYLIALSKDRISDVAPIFYPA